MNFRKNSGITLIALVITIIVLLILAGVSLSLIAGSNGIMEKAQNAVTDNSKAKAREKLELVLSDLTIEKHTNPEYNAEKFIDDKIEEEGMKISGDTVTVDEWEFELDRSVLKIKTEIGKIPETEDSEGEEKPKEPIFTTVANAPDINGFNKENTYYVAWDLTSSPYTIQETNNLTQTPPSNWYDYTQGVNHWANVKTTGGGNDCYWVWIPRYAYKVPTRSSTAQTIDVKFLQEDTNIPIGETEEITNTTPTPGEWVVHPAFTNVGNGGFGELTGIWVAKYEASSNSSSVVENPTAAQLAIDGGSSADTDLKVRVRPNVTSWRGITVGNIFTVCQNLTTSGNSVAGATNIDSHMMKNTEWGAVAYLSRSVYGKNGQVYNNPYYNNTTNYSPITGLCGNGPDYSTTIYDDTNTYKYNTTEGVNASTSGNVYGIYDMAGGSWEYVAGVLSSKKSNSTYYNFSNIDTKYYDSYNGYNNTKYGDAVYETSTSSTGLTSWDTDYSRFVDSSYPAFRRGGHVDNISDAGVFAFLYDTGDANTTHDSFRPCLVSPQQ